MRLQHNLTTSKEELIMSGNRKINLNTASRQELDQIANIGQECAERIVEERERRGGFGDISELDSMPGFGQEATKNREFQAYV
jgi:competence protein ComEA